LDKIATPPKGFEIGTLENGDLVVRYRTTGMGCLAVFLAVWLAMWTCGCLKFTKEAIFNGIGINWFMLLFMIPFWFAEVAMIVYAAWFFGSVTVFTLTPEELVAERSLLWFCRRRVLARQEITVVKQIKDGGEGKDSFPTWGLALIGEKEVRILSRQPIEKSDWFGPIIATWAGVAYEPAESAKKQKYETL
jgi:hypothetical protein